MVQVRLWQALSVLCPFLEDGAVEETLQGLWKHLNVRYHISRAGPQLVVMRWAVACARNPLSASVEAWP